MSRWNQPICDNCWDDRYPGREAARITEGYREFETCSYCGSETQDGIYVRDDPATVPFPPPEGE